MARLGDSSKESCQRISDLSDDDCGFPCLSTTELLTRVGLIPARVATELVRAPLEAGMALQSAVYIFFL